MKSLEKQVNPLSGHHKTFVSTFITCFVAFFTGWIYRYNSSVVHASRDSCDSASSSEKIVGKK
jgi:amino acid permease